ncbi:MAG TPA: hypothetical protein ENI57_00595 [Ignavibacteria bacterium]|nr:hypothetical protein [Ignavibacteria bacterium]
MSQNDNKQFIDCPKCGEKIEITQALMVNIERDVKRKLQENYDTKWKLREEKLREETERVATENNNHFIFPDKFTEFFRK